MMSPPPRNELKWVAVDLDGTLAEGIWTPDDPTSKIGGPIWGNIEKARALHAAGDKIVIHTARPSSDYEIIEAWLLEHDVPFRHIETGKILARCYVDDRAVPADAPDWSKPYSHTRQDG